MTTLSKAQSTLFRRLAPLAAILLVSGNLFAQQVNTVTLSGSAEVPPVTTAATGNGEITVNADRSVSGTLRISGLVPTMAHIHEAAAGANGPPIITLNKGSDGNFVVPAGARLTEAQYSAYLAGNLYVNVHSAAHPNGEIRGQLMRMEGAGTQKRSGY